MYTDKPDAEEVERTLDSITGIRRAEMPDFFYTRLEGRLNKVRRVPGFSWSFLTRPAVSLACLSLLLVLNITIIRSLMRTKQSASVTTNTVLQNFAEEYALGTTSIYNEKVNR